jgi:hypothetical protein
MAKVCSVTGCDNKYRARGLCSTHWKINKKHGTPVPICWCGEPVQTFTGNQPQTKYCEYHTFTERFWNNVSVKSDKECWEWQGTKTAAGYGVIWYDNKLQYSHRIALELNNKAIPNRWHACHTCDNPSCVNPNHLYVGTPQDNMNDKVSKGRHIFGEKHPNAKLTDKEVNEIRVLFEDGMWQTDLAKVFNVDPSHISRIVYGLIRRN